MKKLFAASLMTAALLMPLQAFAGDTTEVIDKDTLEVDPSFSIDGMGDGKPSVNTGIGIVYGVLDGFNIGASISYGSAEGMAGGNLGLGVNALWTPVDTDHFDLDVMADFDFEIGGGYSITPSVELNYDLEPDTALWGLYLRFGLPIYGGYVAGDILHDEAAVEAKADVGIALTLGTYFSFAEIHQILLEGGFNVDNLAKNLGDAGISGAFISLGYNVQITDTFELTTELAFNLPTDEDNFSATLAVGGIFGLLNK